MRGKININILPLRATRDIVFSLRRKGERMRSMEYSALESVRVAFNLMRGDRIRLVNDDGKGVVTISSSANQSKSLEPVIRQLEKLDVPVSALLAERHQKYGIGFVEVVAFVGTVLLCLLRPEHRSFQGRCRITTTFEMLHCWFGTWMLFDFSKCSYILVANDHLPFFRVMAHLASTKGVPTGYLQHAHVSTAFPPLDIWSDAFLDGEVAFSIYESVSKSMSNSKIVGATRFEQTWRARNEFEAKRERKLSFAIAFDYELKLFSYLCQSNFSQFSGDLPCFFHPRTPEEKRIAILENLRSRGIAAVERVNRDSNRFVDVETIFVHQSSVALDAMASGAFVLSIGDDQDYYGFIAQELVRNFRSFNEAFCWLGEAGVELELQQSRLSDFLSLDVIPSEIVAAYVKERCEVNLKWSDSVGHV